MPVLYVGYGSKQGASETLVKQELYDLFFWPPSECRMLSSRTAPCREIMIINPTFDQTMGHYDQVLLQERP